MTYRKNFSPMCFLASLGAGGLSVSFFMYLMFLVPHPKVPLATFDFVMPALLKGDWLSIVVGISLVFILVFAFFHFKLLIFNVKQFNLYKKSESYNKLINSNSQVTLMAIPLTFAMTINVCFVLGAVFVPGLWEIVEYMFPFAILGFVIAGYFALKIFFDYFSRLIIKGNFDFATNNNLSQMISIFAFAMVGVGFAAPAAMSHNIVINAIAFFGSIFFASLAILLIFIKLTIGIKNIFESGISMEAAPSLWIIIPILTLLGITFVRLTFGLDHNFQAPMEKTSLFILLSIVLSLQILFGLLGYKVMKSIGYFDKYIHSEDKSAVSFALICPGVAFMVLGMFFINFGLTLNGIIDKYSVAYFILMIPFIFVQYKTIAYFFKLNKKFQF
ncbi:hypothetical protein GCM10012288_05060 [Malaciobacter pacificus]|uniref:Putative membrane protein n=1 Tax=Malaciobacter pacificus TaxID=1080223 RepID=A0A5C2HCF2_9BACT|nr:hypothetical protein [Malaciobacter pacificus]QEP34494.1 putative membrane protein [Malaciobacter pacificus]GGD34070.1 hypothetical protein GCM10012288_05060 [Malaciobacter pacificus]